MKKLFGVLRAVLRKVGLIFLHGGHVSDENITTINLYGCLFNISSICSSEVILTMLLLDIITNIYHFNLVLLTHYICFVLFNFEI